MFSLVIAAGLLAFASSVPTDIGGSSHHALLLSLNKNLLRSLEGTERPPNPSVHLALRLSDYHNFAMEGEHLKRLKDVLHADIQSSLSANQPVVGRLALYTLALRSSCQSLCTITFTADGKSKALLTHLKNQMEDEKEHIVYSHRPLTNYYQYSLGVLALCASDVAVNSHVSNKLVKAVEHERFTHGDSESVDTYAMAGMALQCVKDAGYHVQSAAGLDAALSKIKLKLLAAQRTDGHIGNEFSTGLAVQALFAMGSHVAQCVAAMEAMRMDAASDTYHNPMAMSQVLPALQQKSYLMVRGKECPAEEDTLVLEPTAPAVVLRSETKVPVTVEVVTFSRTTTVYDYDVTKGSSLLEALELLRRENSGFTFETESSLWGPFLSVVNGEQARQSDRRYWQLSSDGSALTEGMSDYRIEAAQKITIKNTGY